jgi:hypothetical protein
MEVSRGTAYGIGFSQCAVTLGVILFFPPVDVDVYHVQGHINLTTRVLLVDPAKDIRGVRIFMSMPTFLSSLLAASFSTMTYHAYDMGFAGQDYNVEALEQSSLWNLTFWLYCLLVHGVVALIVMDPVDVFAAVSGTCFMVFFLHRICYPRGSVLNLTQANLNVLGYCLGMAQIGYQITDARPFGCYAIMMLLVFDYALGFGHTFDMQATLDTIANCRLCYVCIISLSLAFLYAISGPELSLASGDNSVVVVAI